jgi:hypothetical protein
VRAWGRKAVRDLASMVVLTGVMTVLFIIGDLIVHGRVNW